MHLHCVLESKPFLLLKALLKNMCPHNEVILLSVLLMVVVVFCKIKILLVRGVGCCVEESSLKPTFRDDLATNMKDGVCFLKFSLILSVSFPLILGFMCYKILCLQDEVCKLERAREHFLRRVLGKHTADVRAELCDCLVISTVELQPSE